MVIVHDLFEAARSLHSLPVHGLTNRIKADEAIAEADTLLLTVPNQLGVAYNAHAIEAILTLMAPLLAGAEHASDTVATRIGGGPLGSKERSCNDDCG
jgi:hypothetical protein